jgi:outer membrane receptor protein involved in Fe transport
LVSGFEVRDSSLQISPTTSFEPNAAETGFPGNVIGGSDQLDQLDLGLYSQLSYRLYKDVKFVAGGRLDYDRVRNTLGYGAVFNPRVALIYTPRSLVFKVIYAEGFKAPSNSERYGTIPQVNEVANPGIENEKIKNLEVSAGWEMHDRLAVEVSAYQSIYSNIVSLQEIPNPHCAFCGVTGQFQNIGKIQVRGLQAQARYHDAKFDAFLNYTYTDPRASQVRVGDIASNHLNFGLSFKPTSRFSVDVRTNFVGSRRTGAGTTVPTNQFRQIDAYTTTDVVLTFNPIKALRESRVQLGIENLFNELYFDPGISEAGGIFAARLPQASRSAFLRLSTKY